MDVVLDLARALRDPDPLLRAHPDHPTHAANLSSGVAGLALLFAYLARAEHAGTPGIRAERVGVEDFLDLAETCLGIAVEAMAEQPMGSDLYSGFAGITWAVTHVDNLVAEMTADAAGSTEPGDEFDSGATATDDEDDEDDEDDGQFIDQTLHELLTSGPWHGQYDLISGLVGYGVYAIERLPRPSARACLDAVLDRLEERAERSDDFVTWFTQPELLPPHQRERCPDGYYNLGLSHGVPGVIALLGLCHALGVATERVDRLLDGAVSWLLARANPPSLVSRYSAAYVPGTSPDHTRAAWCYGDPGVAAALRLAARTRGRDDWAERARDLALAVTRRAEDYCGVTDAGLCHGSTGLILLDQHMYADCRDPAFLASARRWVDRTLGMRGPDEAERIAGFRFWVHDYSIEELSWRPARGLLNGAVGVALTLLAAVSEVAPDWDRILLLSGPPASARAAVG
ncbi:lanthionine synthetase C family protein [Haliangium sp.]|uniref:lanthionine synthetase C family protein n=1 Tax=Haliangium sp. TaxID=2663208 RepID=UPI003D11B97C